jgi:hypothetical protein
MARLARRTASSVACGRAAPSHSAGQAAVHSTTPVCQAASAFSHTMRCDSSTVASGQGPGCPIIDSRRCITSGVPNAMSATCVQNVNQGGISGLSRRWGTPA